jgi:hypothetical protein
MSISTPQRPSADASDPDDRTTRRSAREASVRVVSRSGRRELGLRATPLADAVEQTVRWYRARARPPSAADHGRTRHVASGLEVS